LAETVGLRTNAEMLLRAKVTNEDLQLCAQQILQRLGFESGTYSATSAFQGIPDAAVSEWATRVFVNTLVHLCTIDDGLRSAYLRHHSFVPAEAVARQLFLEKFHKNFVFFLWLVASPSCPVDLNNRCLLRFVVLSDVILLEDITATKAAQPGGWGWLDKSIEGLRDVAKAFDIHRIKAVATNKRAYEAFLRRGFEDQAGMEGFDRHIENYAKPVETSWTHSITPP
jgi:hypothetical protein